MIPLIDTSTHVAAMRPGERLVAGKPYIFSLDLLNLHLAHEDVLSAPADLSGLSYEDVFGLWMAAHKVAQATPSDARNLPYRLHLAAARALRVRAADERALRPEYLRSYGKVA